jgi:hypothetical protein
MVCGDKVEGANVGIHVVYAVGSAFFKESGLSLACLCADAKTGEMRPQWLSRWGCSEIAIYQTQVRGV